jgi:hypothetical protein
LSISLVMVV